MSAWAERLVRIIAAICILGGSALGAVAQTDLRIMAPAAPGGGWDQTARAVERDAALLVGDLFRMLERQVEERAFRHRDCLIEPARDCA